MERLIQLAAQRHRKLPRRGAAVWTAALIVLILTVGCHSNNADRVAGLQSCDPLTGPSPVFVDAAKSPPPNLDVKVGGTFEFVNLASLGTSDIRLSSPRSFCALASVADTDSRPPSYSLEVKATTAGDSVASFRDNASRTSHTLGIRATAQP